MKVESRKMKVESADSYRNWSVDVICKRVSYLLLFTFHFSLFSQDKYFDPQPENFMKQLGVLFKENQHDELEELHKKLEKEFKSKKINDYQLNKMCDILNVMHERKMNVYPMYKEFISGCLSATNSGFDENFQDRWYLFVKGILENAKKGNNKDFKIFMDFSNDLFSQNALVAEKSKTYRIETKDLSFAYDKGNFIVKVPLTNIQGFFKTDTVYIFNTSGEYNIMEKVWTGNMGLINWQRVGFAASEVSASFGRYKIDMSKPEYTIDSVMLTYPEYFPKPILGKLVDKITKEQDFTTVRYPQFTSYNKNYSFDNKIAANLRMSGGFVMKGPDVVVGSEDGSAVKVAIFNLANTKKLLEAEGLSCIFKRGQFIRMDKSRIKIFAGKDSVTHPYASLKYEVQNNQILILGEEYGSGKARYLSSFHNMAFDAEMITWKITEDEMNLSMLVGRGKNASKFISENNFDQETYNQARTASTDLNPLSILVKLSKDGSYPIPLDNLVAAYGPSFSSSSVLPAVFALEKDGFLNYSSTDQTITINKNKVNFYQKAYQKQIDYDLLRFKGYGDKSIGKFSLSTNKISVNRVAHIPFNDSSYAHAYPYKSSNTEVGKNRQLKFAGKVLAGRLDFYGSDYKFSYDSFSIKSDSIDKLKINIPEKKDKASGEELLQPLKSALEQVKAQIYINGKFNKSGMQSARMYPKMTTYANSFVYYDNPNIYRGRYKRENFFFKVFPFKKDSLLHFEPSALFYDGELNSADIFPIFKEKLTIQKDLSLGFSSQTPAAGYKNYKGKGNFMGSINLSNSGLVGKGELSYMTATLGSDSILYFPDQTNLLAKTVEMKEQKGLIEYPQLSADSTLVEWRPYSDTMLLASTKNNPFEMFNQGTKMHGLLILENNGLSGDGFLDFEEAKITSNQMRFKSTTMKADTSSMEIKGLGNKLTFKTPNVSCFMNFETKIGDFKSNEKDISTNFAYNQYKGEINEFRWDINKKILTFSAKEGTMGSRFTSTHPMQDSLTFYCKKAEYNMVSSIIKMEGVEEILIADSRIIPDGGKVNIFPEAKMETLKNATIEGDTANMYHVIEKATLDINGKNDVLGYGEYTLKVNNQDYPIRLHSIKVDKKKLPIEKKSKIKKYTYTIEGTGKVEKSQNLKIYRNTEFHGNVHIFLNKKYPHFSGMQRIEFTNPSYKSPWFTVDNEINVSELSMHKKELKAENEKELHTGFFIDRENHTGWYTGLLAPLKGESDNIALDGRGVIKHLPLDNHYYFGDSTRILSGASTGTKLDYFDAEGTIDAEGKINPALRIGGIPFIMAGLMQNDMNASSYKFMGGAGMNITIDPKVMSALSNFIATEFETNKDISYIKKETRYAFNELCHPKDYINFFADVDKGIGIQNGPKYTPFNILFTDLIMDYDKADNVFRSKPELGISMFGGMPINKLSQGHLEIGYGEIFDYFTLYIKSKNREWLYMSYSDGELGILTSNEFVNGTINQIDPRKRTVRKSASEYYIYKQAGSYEIESFVKRMGKGGKYNEEEKKIVPNPDKEKPSEKEINGLEIINDKSPELEELEEQEKKQLSAEEAELKALEAELKALEDQKEALKKATAEKGVQLEEFSNENKKAPNLEGAPKESPSEEKAVETPAEETQSEKASTEGEKKEGEESLEEDAPESPRAKPDESPDEKKKSEPEKKEEGQSLFDTMF